MKFAQPTSEPIEHGAISADPSVTLRVYFHVLREHSQGIGDVFAQAISASVSNGRAEN